jgi:signal transduction histidine kinase
VDILLLVGVLVSVLASRTEHARREAIAATSVRDTFLSTAAHELRTPLTTAKATVQLAQRRSERTAAALQHHDPEAAAAVGAIGVLLARAHAALARQNRLVDELLDASRLHAHSLVLQVERCDLADVVREACVEQQQAHPHRELRLDLPDSPIFVLADVLRIGQVVTNYLTNALKFAPAEQPLEVSLTVDVERACVSVHDRGPGLSTEEQAHVWDIYYRVPGMVVVSGSNIGLGLGLYLCRSIVVPHAGGQVGVESGVGEGSTFWFTLPLASVDQ